MNMKGSYKIQSDKNISVLEEKKICGNNQWVIARIPCQTDIVARPTYKCLTNFKMRRKAMEIRACKKKVNALTLVQIVKTGARAI